MSMGAQRIWSREEEAREGGGTRAAGRRAQGGERHMCWSVGTHRVAYHVDEKVRWAKERIEASSPQSWSTWIAVLQPYDFPGPNNEITGDKISTIT
eukprot:6412576-Prymnesium_polylepis.2